MMSHRSRQELLDAVRARYAQAKRCQKTLVLDELVANSGYNRKYAITVLRHPR
jgi:protein-disulfide isomerase-like protein with CxxC motif